MALHTRQATTPEKVTLRHLLTERAERMGLTTSAIETLVTESQVTHWRPGAQIVGPDDAHDLLNFIVGGVVKVLSMRPRGTPLIVQFSPPGQFIHTGWLFEGRPRRRKFIAVAHEQCTIAVMSQAVVTGVMHSLPTRCAIRLTTYGLRGVSSLVEEKCLLLRMRLRERVGYQLRVPLARDFGRECPEGLLIDLALSRDDLAQLVGGAPHAVSRILATLRAQGRIMKAHDRRLVLTRTFLEEG